MPKAKLDNAYEILLDYGYIEPGVSDREYWEALKQATLDFQEEGNVEYFDIVRAEEKELRDKVVPKIKKTKISAAAFKKGTSQDIKPNTEVTSLAIRKPRPDITSKDITPEVPEEETVVEPKQPSLGEGFKNILNSIAGSTESIKNLLLGQKESDQQAAKDARKSREDSKRNVKEKKIESRVFDGLKKIGEKVVAPVKGLFGQIWDFIKTLILSAVVGKLIKWIQNPKNQKKVQSVFRFIKDWWPALLAGWLLFGTGIGSLITGTVAAIAGFIPVLTGLLAPLAAFAASPIGLAVLATGGIAAFLATQKNKTDQAVDESVATKGRDKTVSDLKEEDANKNIFQKAGGFITGENQERKEQIQRVETGTEKRYGFFGELPQPAQFNKGGLVQNFNTGGSVPGQGNTDTVPAMLTPGEFVLTKEATEKYGTDTLEGMNAAAATGKKETSGTGRIIGSTLGGFTGGVVGFFADSPVSPVADIALGLAGSAAGGEIGDNVERKVRGMKKGGKVVEDDGLGYGIKGDTRTFLPGKIDPNNKSAGAGEMVVPEGASAITGKEKEKIEAETLYWVNKERAFMGIEPPLKKITYSQGVYLAKAKGPGPRTKEHTSTTDDWENMTRTSSTTKWIEGKGTTMSSSMRRLSPEEREQYLANNPYARIAASIKNQSELDNLGADISASAKKSAGYNKGGLVQHFNKGGLVQEMKKLQMEHRRIKPGPNGKYSKEDNARKGQLILRITKLRKQIENYDNTSGENRRSIPKKSEKNPANFLQPQGFQSKKGGRLGRLIGGIADVATLGMFDFDNKSGGGLLRKVVGGTADALTGNRWDFDNQGKPEVKSEPPKITGKLKPADITPPVVGGAAGKPNITTMNMNQSGMPVDISEGDGGVNEIPNFSPIAMRSRDKIKTLGIMV